MPEMVDIKKNIGALKQNIFVIRKLIERDRKHNLSATFMGELWEILNPLIHMIVLVLVFERMFGHGKASLYPLFILTGTTVFNLFTQGTTLCLNALSSNKGFLIKTQLKKSIYVLEKVLLSFRNFLYSLIVYAVMLAYYRLAPNPAWLYVIPDIFLLMVMILGMGKLLAVINVSFADITYFYKIFTLIMMYGSAIFYHIDQMPSYVQAVMVINPIYTSIAIARTAIMDNAGSPPVMWAVMAVYAAGFYALGTYVFNKEADHIVGRL